jgi:hypothetical protein
MVKAKNGLWGLIALIMVPTLAQSEETCADVYARSVADISIKVRHDFEFDYLWTKHCEKNGELRQESTKLDLTIPVKEIVVGFSGSQQEATQRMQQFCKEHLQERLAQTDTYDYQRTVVNAAQNSFNDCRALELNGVRMSHSIQEPRSVVIRADFDPSKTKVMFRGAVYDQKIAKCTTTALTHDGTPTIITAATKETPVQPFSITCERTPTKTANGALKFDRFTAAVVTNHGTYTVERPDEGLFGFDLASQSKLRYDRAVADRDTLAAEKAALMKQLDGVSAEIHLFVHGQFPQGAGYWEHTPCERGPDAFAKSVCKDRKYVIRPLAYGLSGNSCGYNYGAVACINK